jgi:hypothetical protein
MGSPQTESRKAFHELLDLLREVDERWLGPEWMIQSAGDVAEGHRALAHLLQGGLFSHFEDDPDHPVFRRIVSPSRKFTGDNPDAIYYDAAVRPERTYRIRGSLAGAVYVSLTVEAGAAEGRFGSRTAGVLNDTQFDVAPDGSFEVVAGGPPRGRNWLPLPPEAARITTRHYFEDETSAAADPRRRIPLEIETLEALPPPAAPDDASVAAGLRRVANFVRSRTLEQPAPGQGDPPAFVSRVPNQLPPPVKPGDFALAAADAAYSMAPYVLGPDQALLMTGRWPACRCACVCLWNRWMQTYDFAHRRVSLNRRQTRLEPDGSFRMLIAHRDPGVPNWIDTEGRPFGLIFWRFMLPEGEIETPRAEVVPLAEL